MLDFDSYKVEGTFLEKPKKPKPLVINTEDPVEIRKYADDLEEYAKKIDEYKEELKRRRDIEKKLMDKFKEDVLYSFGYKANDALGLLIFRRAWDFDHSSLGQVYWMFEELHAFTHDILGVKKIAYLAKGIDEYKDHFSIDYKDDIRYIERVTYSEKTEGIVIKATKGEK
jgi:hypothetical protein